MRHALAAAATLLPLLLALAPRPAAAQQVNVELDEDLARSAGLDPATVDQRLRTDLDTALQVGDQQAYMQKMANASVMAAKGLGVDYATNVQRFVVGGGFGSAVNSAGAQFGRGDGPMPEGGFAFQASAMAGLNLGLAGREDGFWRRIRIFANGMATSRSHDPFSGTLLNYGGHLQLQLIRSRDAAVVEWGGLALTSGYEHARYTLTLEEGLPIESDGVTWDAVGTYTITSSASSVPVELSTNLRVLLFTLYGGLGMDYNLDAYAQSEVSLGGDIKASAQGQSQRIGAASVTMASRGLAEAATPRMFLGAQVNASVLKLYGHLNVGFERSFGGHVGARIAL